MGIRKHVFNSCLFNSKEYYKLCDMVTALSKNKQTKKSILEYLCVFLVVFFFFLYVGICQPLNVRYTEKQNKHKTLLNHHYILQYAKFNQNTKITNIHITLISVRHILIIWSIQSIAIYLAVFYKWCNKLFITWYWDAN